MSDNDGSRSLFKENDKILELIHQRNDVIRELTDKINENNKIIQDKLTLDLQHYDVMEELQKLQRHNNELKRIIEEQNTMINDANKPTGGKKRKTRKVKKGKKTRKVKKGKKTKKSKKSRKYKK
jgi:Mg2+ and Co2+ transporter CorA